MSNTIGVITESLRVLQEMAEQEREDMLTYLIAMAIAEAEDVAVRRAAEKPQSYHS